MDEILIYPKDATIYQGLRNNKHFSNWFTNDIGYASAYTFAKNKTNKPCIKIFKTNKYLRLLNIEKVKLSNLSNKKNIVISSDDNLISITISLRDIYKIIYGRGCNKLPQIKTENDIEDLINLDEKFKNTQYFYIYIISKILGIEKFTIQQLKNVIKKNDRKQILKRNEFNRISRVDIDNIFLENLKINYPNIDGFYAPDIQNDFYLWEEYGYYFQKSEIALFNNKDLRFIKLVSKPAPIRYLCKCHNKC